MITITKGRLLTIKQWRETYGPGSNVVLPAEEAEELARIALASLEADPVKRVNSDQMHRVCLEANRYLDKYDAMAKEVNKLLGRIAPPAPVFNGEYGDAYQGAREDLSIWKRRALEADEHVRRLEQINDHMVKEAQGESRMGEPVIREPAPVVPEEATPENVEMLSGYVSTYKLTDSERDIAAEIWNACRAAMLQSGNFRENKNSSTNNFREIAETSTNYPAIPSEVLSAILKVARIRADFDDFDGDRRGIGDCLDEAEQELIVTINKYASQLAAEPIATNDVREQQTAVPPVPEIQDDVAQAIENLKQKLVECNRYNYCADAVKGVEDACRAAMLHAGNFREIPETSTNSPVTPTLLPGGFTVEDAKELHEDLVRSHISQALSGEKMKKKDREADLRWIHDVIVQAAWFVKASLEALPEPPQEVNQ